MFARRRSPANHPEGRSTPYKDVVLCDNAPFPLTLPGALIGTIWDEVNNGMSVRGGAEVGGLLVGYRPESASTIATAVVPIRIEYQFGPSFRLSLGDLKGVRALMDTLQNDSSGTVVGFYRSRTRNDSLSEESESELLALLEQSHRSFATDFHYYVALTPVSKTVMTASASYRAQEGWTDWQHVWLVRNASPSQPVESPVPSGETQAADSPLEKTAESASGAPSSESKTSPDEGPLNAVRGGPLPLPGIELGRSPEPSRPPYFPRDAEAYAPPAVESSKPEPPDPNFENVREININPRLFAYGAVAILLAVVAFAIYERIRPSSHAVTTTETASIPLPAAPLQPAAPPATGLAASRENGTWKITWDRSQVGALHPRGAMLSIRDGGKEQEFSLTAADLAGGAIFYESQSSDLVFTLSLVTAGGQLAEEHIRVLQGTRKDELPAVASSNVPASDTPVRDNHPNPVADSRPTAPRDNRATPVGDNRGKTVADPEVRVLRPFKAPPNRPEGSSGNKPVAADLAAPPAFAASPSQPPSTVFPIGPAVSVVRPPTPQPAKSLASTEAGSAPARAEFGQPLSGIWVATVSQSPIPTDSATVTLTVFGGNANGWFQGNYKVPKKGPPIRPPVSFEFRGNLSTDKIPDGGWVFPFRSSEGWGGTIKLRPQGSVLDVTWKASLDDGNTYVFEHVMSRKGGDN